MSQQYNRICKTHKKLVKTGAVQCSVSLSDTPPTVNLPSSPSSPGPEPAQLGGSVHWGAVGDFSGVPTPYQTPDTSPRPSVITSAPSTHTLPPPRLAVPPPNHPVVARQQILPSPTLLEGISVLLQDLQSLPSPHSPSPTSLRPVPRNSSTDPDILTVRQIPIVTTSVSSLESDSSEVFAPVTTNMSSLQDIIKKEGRALTHLGRDLKNVMDEVCEEDVTANTDIDGISDNIKKLRSVYLNGVEDFLEDYAVQLEQDIVVKNAWKDDIPYMTRRVKQYLTMLRTKKENLYPTPQLSDLDRQTMEVNKSTMQFHQLSLDQMQKTSNTQVADKTKQSEIMAETESNTFLGECSVIGDMMDDEDWEQADDETVSNAMRKLSKWQDQMTSIERGYRKFENMALEHNFPQEKQEAIKTTYQDKKDFFENTKEAVLREDAARCLFTLEPVKSDIIKYPIFSGLPSEDYLQFKEKMTLRFRENKVRRKEQVSKLRECLKGAALGRVPDGVKDIEEAFNRLNEAFGNPSKVMAYQLKALDDIGMMPADKQANGQLSYTRRIEWLLKLEVILGKILELSQRSSKLAHEAFGSSTYRKLWSRFPTAVLDKLVKIQGEDAERMEAIIDKIKEMRKHSQVMDDECGNPVGGAKKRVDGPTPNRITVEVFFRSPQQFAECRVCVHLSAVRKNQRGLFENHLSNYPTGCPKFIEASMDLRRNLVEKIKFCPQCFNPDIVFTRDHISDCQFTKSPRKNAYICTISICRTHMWICLPHKV